MDYMMDVLLCGLTTFGILIGAIVIGVLIQAISYRVFKFNLYKWLNHILFEKEWNI